MEVLRLQRARNAEGFWCPFLEKSPSISINCCQIGHVGIFVIDSKNYKNINYNYAYNTHLYFSFYNRSSNSLTSLFYTNNMSYIFKKQHCFSHLHSCMKMPPTTRPTIHTFVLALWKTVRFKLNGEFYLIFEFFFNAR